MYLGAITKEWLCYFIDRQAGSAHLKNGQIYYNIWIRAITLNQ